MARFSLSGKHCVREILKDSSTPVYSVGPIFWIVRLKIVIDSREFSYGLWNYPTDERIYRGTYSAEGVISNATKVELVVLPRSITVDEGTSRG